MNDDIESEIGAKAEREARLRWQSWVVVGIVTLGLVGYLCSALMQANPGVTGVWRPISVSIAFGLLVYFLKAATPSGALMGTLITLQFITVNVVFVLIFEEPEYSWDLILHSLLLPEMLFFLLIYLASKAGRLRKERLGIAESKRGRNAGQVAANLGPTSLLVCCLLLNSAYESFCTHHAACQRADSEHIGMLEFASFGLVAALGESVADTLSSEIGPLFGGSPRLITTMKRVPAGTDGAVSLLGTSVGILGALLLIALIAWGSSSDFTDFWILGVGATFGLMLDSFLGATVERKGWLNNDAVNFLSGLSAAACAGGIIVLRIALHI